METIIMEEQYGCRKEWLCIDIVFIVVLNSIRERASHFKCLG